MNDRIGIVVIGRNEGERLSRCLESLRPWIASVVYVDSGSSDGSVEFAQGIGAEVVKLATDVPFTAARARNEGFRRLARMQPTLQFVQFVDGDCEVAAGWLETAAACLEQYPTIAVVCGRRRERCASASIYNQLCDVEWDTPIGAATACGGDSMIRASAFKAVEGFASDVIAGEEPELCVRLRAAGWSIRRLDHEMTLHDAAMTKFSQWWRRSMRGGFAYALGMWMHGKSHGHWVRESARIWMWALVIPLVVLCLAPISHGLSLIALLLYPVTGLRAAKWRRNRGDRWGVALLYGTFCVLGKWPELFGQIKFLLSRFSKSPDQLIEYKSATVG